MEIIIIQQGKLLRTIQNVSTFYQFNYKLMVAIV